MRKFLGIRYAEPPFGANRFLPPVPVEHTGDCLEFGPISPQSVELPGSPVWRPGDEDILSLNVWAPSEQDGPLPVLFFIHGGAYTFGSSAQPEYDGTELARAGLVVVTCNYRLGFEGFGHVPGKPDNRGLLDQIAALRWVRDHIAAYGGDPENVTVAGHSAGAGSVACLMVMPQARGLFRRAIAHSIPGRYFSPEFAATIAAEIDASTPATAVASSDQLVHRIRTDPDALLHHDPIIYQPIIDGTVLPASPLAGDLAPDVDLLVCHAIDEYRIFHALGLLAPVTTEPELIAFARRTGIPDEVVAGYRMLMPHASLVDLYIALFGAETFTEFTSRFAERHGRAYVSRFTRPPAWHCADVPFAFGTLDCVPFLIGGPPTEEDRAMSRRMTDSWASFARTGDPGWPRDTVQHWGDPADVTPFREVWRDVDFTGTHPASFRSTA